MKRFMAMMGWLLVALWPLATNHCKLEEIPGLAFLICCDHEESVPHQDDDCEADGCALVESGAYKTENNRIVVDGPALLFVMVSLPALEDFASASPGGNAPPRSFATGLPKLWQFAQRAALPPRAPSFVS